MSTIFPLSASVGQVFNGYEFDGTRWNLIGIDLTTDYLEESSASVIYLDKISASSTYATINYVDTELSNIDLTETINTASAAAVTYLVDSAPVALDTLNELAAALGDDENFAGTVTNSLSNKLNISDASATYLKQVDASAIYLTQINASTTYATLSTSQELSNKTLIEPQIEISGPLSVLSYPQNSGYFDDSNFNLSYGGLLDVSYVSFDSNTNILSLNIPNFPTFLIPVFVAGAYVSGQSLSNKVTSYSAFTANGSSVTVDLDELFGPGTKNLSEIVLKFWYGSTPSTAAFSIQSSTITISSTELSYLDGVSSNVQNQLNSKLSIVSASSTYATKTELENIDALPDQTGNDGKYLTTNGASASWADVAGAVYQDEAPVGVPEGTIWVDSNASASYLNTNDFLLKADVETTPVYLMNSGGSAQRPSPAIDGMFRFNTDSGEPEWYSEEFNSWTKFANSPAYAVEYLVIAGGGGGGQGFQAGGGGAGGYRSSVVGELSGRNSQSESLFYAIPTNIYSVVIGAGGAGGPAVGSSSALKGSNGGNSSFDNIISLGGGGGGSYFNDNNASGLSGGSGGGAGNSSNAGDIGGSGTLGQGFDGGSADGYASPYAGGGGGGAGQVGANGGTVYGNGGNGIVSNITGSAVTRAGGGAPGAYYTTNPVLTGGSGGGGNGGFGDSGLLPTSGTVNTGGGGGGGGGTNTAGASGGSGIVVLRYSGIQRATGGNTVQYSNGYTYHIFTSSGSFVA